MVFGQEILIKFYTENRKTSLQCSAMQWRSIFLGSVYGVDEPYDHHSSHHYHYHHHHHLVIVQHVIHKPLDGFKLQIGQRNKGLEAWQKGEATILSSSSFQGLSFFDK